MRKIEKGLERKQRGDDSKYGGHALYETPPFELRIEQYAEYKDARGKVRKKKLARRFDEVHILPGAIKCRVCETYDRCLSRRCMGFPVGNALQWLFHLTNWRLHLMREITDPKVRDEYRDLCMMRDRLKGHSFVEIGAAWGCTARTAGNHVRKVASECMRQAMAETRGDPEHPAPGSFTVEKFTGDPRACMEEIMHRWIAKIEERYPEVQ